VDGWRAGSSGGRSGGAGGKRVRVREREGEDDPASHSGRESRGVGAISDGGSVRSAMGGAVAGKKRGPGDVP